MCLRLTLFGQDNNAQNNNDKTILNQRLYRIKCITFHAGKLHHGVIIQVGNVLLGLGLLPIIVFADDIVAAPVELLVSLAIDFQFLKFEIQKSCPAAGSQKHLKNLQYENLA